MKILSINSVPYGSTCSVMIGISDTAKQNGHEVFVATGYSTHPMEFHIPHIPIGNIGDKAFHMLLARLSGRNGCYSHLYTWFFLRKVSRLSPSTIHLHNLHGWYINLPMLFRYIKKHNMRVVWTLHDCWAMTGQCPHFVMIKCDKWKTGCHHCPQYRQYPQSYVDRAKTMWKFKKKWFTGVRNMTIVTPSHWLAELVKESFLKEYPVRVIHNGIDLSVFRPTESDFREKYHCENKHLVLGVAFDWGQRKGLDVFIELARRLGSDYKIVLVGTDEKVEQVLPDNIISIRRTQNQKELAEIYSASDVFVNPTREDTFPTVNLEALACGTPVVTFRTGGSPECIDENCGCVVETNNVDILEQEIRRICNEKPFSEAACIRRAAGFDMRDRFEEYVRLYEE